MTCPCTNSNLGRAVALLGREQISSLRGYLGDDFTDGGGDGADMIVSGDGGGGGSSDSIDWAAIASGDYVPPPDAQFSQVSYAPQDYIPFSDIGPGGVQGVTTADGGFIDTSGTTYFPDGSQLSSLGTYTDAAGNVTFSDGTTVLADGTYIGQDGTQYPPTSPQAQQAQQRAAAAGGSSGGSSGGGGGSKGGGSGSQQNPLQQAICIIAPNSPQCRQAQLQASRQQQSSSSSFSTWFKQNWGYLALGAGALIIVPPLLQNALGGRR